MRSRDSFQEKMKIKTKTFLSCRQYSEKLNNSRVKLCLFLSWARDHKNQLRLFNRVASIESLYTELKFTKNTFQSMEELSQMCHHQTSRLISQQQMVRPLYLQSHSAKRPKTEMSNGTAGLFFNTLLSDI